MNVKLDSQHELVILDNGAIKIYRSNSIGNVTALGPPGVTALIDALAEAKLIDDPGELEKASSRIQQLVDLIRELVSVLPGSSHFVDFDESWDWSWDELSDDAQRKVQRTRQKAIDMLVAHSDET